MKMEGNIGRMWKVKKKVKKDEEKKKDKKEEEESFCSFSAVI